MSYVFYHLTATDFAGNEGDEATVAWTSDAAEQRIIPASFALHQNQPNPGRSETVIVFDLPGACKVRLQIFDVAGRRVATLAKGEHIAGRHAVTWNGQGQAGVYFYNFTAGEFEQTRRMLIAR